MAELHYLVSFEDTELAEANRYAKELGEALFDADADIQVTQQRNDPATMDFGGTLDIVLNAVALVALAKGVADWLRRRTSASITITTREGKVVAKNVTSKDAINLLKIMQEQSEGS